VRIYLAILFSFSLFFNLFSQEEDVVKLRKQLYSSEGNPIQIANQLRDIYDDTTIDSLFSVGNFLINKGINSDNKSLIIYGKLTLANYFNHLSKTETSIKYLKECIQYYESMGDFEKLADAQNMMGIAHVYNASYETAASWFVKSIKSGDKLDKNHVSYMGQANLTDVYFRQGKYDLAEAEILSFIEKVKKQGLSRGLKKGYDYLGKIYMAKGDKDLAILYYNKAIELALKNGDKMGKAIAYNNIAIAYFELGDEKLSLENFKKALTIRLEIGRPLGICESYYNLGDWNYYTNNLDEAIKYYKISLEIAEENNMIVEKADALKRISETYKDKGNERTALSYLEKYIDVSHQIKLKNQSKEIDLQRISYEMEREEQRLLQMKRERQMSKRVESEQDRGKIIIIGFSLVLGILLISYLFLFAQSKLKNKQKNTLSFSENQHKNSNELESNWNRISHFISKIETPTFQDKSLFQDDFCFIGTKYNYIVSENTILTWDSPLSDLENFILKKYFEKKSHFDYSDIKELIKNQSIIDKTKISYSLIHKSSTGFIVCGENKILIHDKDKMLFLSETGIEMNKNSILISERLKNSLVEDQLWENFTDQVGMIQKMSKTMAIQSIKETWLDYVNKNKSEMIVFIAS
jgi:tetratricopeptide (TPR) repeat protein